MATRPKAVIESRNGEKFSPITIAKNVLTDDGQNLHDILSNRKEDMMTPTIENSSSMFKVGQGDNVDYSSNVVNGAYESMVLKGKSMVNCIQEPSSQDVVLPYEFEDGQYVTINDTKESGALGVELKGQTLVNLARVRSKQVGNAVGEVNIPIKPNTKYIAFSDVTYENASNLAMFLVSPIYVESISGLNGDALYTATVSDKGGTEIGWNQTGAKYVTFTSASNQCYLHIRTGGSTSNLKYNNMQVFEYQEGMENWDIPYFEGMISCKMPTLHTVGNNIVKNSSDVYVFENHDDMNTLSTSTQLSLDANYKQMLRGKEVTISVDAIGENLAPLAVNGTGYNHYGVDISVVFEDGTSQWLSLTKGNGLPFNGSFNGRYCITLTVQDKPIKKVATCHLFCRTTVGRLTLTNVQLEIRNANSNYEPYKTSIISLPEEVVLRSLPNGVCDTFNTRTGVYTQRIKEIVFDGSNDEGWDVYTGDWVLENSTVFCTYISGVKGYTWSNYTGKEAISDKIPSYPDNWLRLNDVLGMTNDNTWARKQFRIPKSYLETDNVDGFRKWLKQNPVTACFELATPIITKINLPSTLKSWNTTTHIYSEIPENTLYPILSHSNPTYPVILKPNTKYSIVANSYSNDHTNSTINFNLGGATASTTVGNRVTTITTPSTLSNELLTMGGRGNKLNNVMVIEGDVVGDEPYFEGICDCKSPILSNVGKNLCDVNRYTLSCGSGAALNSYRGTVIAKNIKVKPNTKYTFSYGKTVNVPSEVILKVMTLTDVVNEDVHVSVYSHKNRIKEHTVPNGGTFTTESHARYIAITTGNFTTTGNILIEDIEIKEATSPTAYESHKSNTTIFEQKDGKMIVLRSLPNGVCDTLNVETGEYTQRIGEVVLDGSENWIVNGYTKNRRKPMADNS